MHTITTTNDLERDAFDAIERVVGTGANYTTQALAKDEQTAAELAKVLSGIEQSQRLWSLFEVASLDYTEGDNPALNVLDAVPRHRFALASTLMRQTLAASARDIRMTWATEATDATDAERSPSAERIERSRPSIALSANRARLFESTVAVCDFLTSLGDACGEIMNESRLRNVLPAECFESASDPLYRIAQHLWTAAYESRHLIDEPEAAIMLEWLRKHFACFLESSDQPTRSQQ